MLALCQVLQLAGTQQFSFDTNIFCDCLHDDLTFMLSRHFSMEHNIQICRNDVDLCCYVHLDLHLSVTSYHFIPPHSFAVQVARSSGVLHFHEVLMMIEI